MNQNPKIQFNTNAILNVPIQMYELDFSFIVNGETFETSRIISDLLSPNISHIHQADPTFNTYIINTENRGSFSYILNLLNFQPQTIPQDELPFLIETLKILENNSIDLTELFPPISEDNALEQLLIHEKFNFAGQKRIKKEIEFISSHFYKFIESSKNELKQLQLSTIEEIIRHESLFIFCEDQLLEFINEIYLESSDSNRNEYSILYRYVLFQNLTKTGINEFIQIYDINHIDHEIWHSISARLLVNTESNNNDDDEDGITSKRYLHHKIEEIKIIQPYQEYQHQHNEHKEKNCSYPFCDLNAYCIRPKCQCYFCDEHIFVHDC